MKNSVAILGLAALMAGIVPPKPAEADDVSNFNRGFIARFGGSVHVDKNPCHIVLRLNETDLIKAVPDAIQFNLLNATRYTASEYEKRPVTVAFSVSMALTWPALYGVFQDENVNNCFVQHVLTSSDNNMELYHYEMNRETFQHIDWDHTSPQAMQELLQQKLNGGVNSEAEDKLRAEASQ